MSSLPPLMPTPLNYAAPPPRNDLRNIAVRQKAIMYCILGYVALIVGQFALPPELRIIVALLAMGVSITAAVFVFMLAISVYNTGIGIVLGILTLIPFLGLLVLLVINSKATGILREHGIRVGLMGANSSQIPGPG
ncbi:MAG: hypothetical protein JWP03_288 [Phycisphaerales bacterium]|nr:hypothetical protein [Phycisphaerales bacterium]